MSPKKQSFKRKNTKAHTTTPPIVDFFRLNGGTEYAAPRKYWKQIKARNNGEFSIAAAGIPTAT